MVNTNLSTLNGSNGFIISGLDENALLGDALSTAGDINGDGIDDIIIGARNTRVNDRNNVGKVYVVLGNNNFAANFDLSALDGTNGFTIEGLNADDLLGIVVSNAGDINNDGIDDIIIGANGVNDNAGASYLIFGQDNFDATINLANLNGSNGFAISGLIPGDLFGTDASSAGDINGDGIPDLIISATEADTNGNTDTGASYVIFGRDEEFEANFNLASLDGSNGFVINNINARDFGGTAVSSAGDINNDGIDDLIIGANFADVGDRSDAGQAYILFGSSVNFTPSVNLSDLNGINGFTLNGIESRDGTGVSVANAGDINSDGIDDIIIGANFADLESRENAGQAYVVFGKDTGFDPFLELSDLDSSNGFTVNGIATDDLLGTSVSGAEDVNGDGISDMILGARGVNENTGASYVIFGREDNNEFSTVLELSDITAEEGFIISSDNTGSLLGESVSVAGDINGDGTSDILVGAPQSEPGGNDDAGESYVIFGGESNSIDLFRFRNLGFNTGTYVFVGEVEKNAILADENLSRAFALDGVASDGTVNPAFTASTTPGDNLIPFYRLKSLDLPGTFLFASTAEYDAIFADDSLQRDKWEEEGFDEVGQDIPEFYLYDGISDIGTQFNRFQNNQNNTFLYAGPGETAQIESDPNLSNVFDNQGIAFKSL